MITAPNLALRGCYFIGVGGFAALVHLSIVLACVSLFAISPLLANVLGFLMAFQVSFLGHKYLTFASLNQKRLSLPHFFIVAATAGLLNEGLYFVFLQYTVLNYLQALIAVLAMVSVFTFVMSRFWACR